MNVTNNASRGQIFVLLGPSSAGKSSVIASLKNADPSWVEMGPDLSGFFHLADLIRDTFPSEYAKLSPALDHPEIAHAVVDIFYKAKEGREGDLSFLKWKQGTYSKSALISIIRSVALDPRFAPLDQSMYTKEVADLVHYKMIDFIKSNCVLGRHVFVDGMGPEMVQEFLGEVKECSIKVGLAYLPLHHLVDRVTKRNELAKSSGDDAEVRSYEQITRQFIDHYRLAKMGDEVIGHISLPKIEKAFSKMRPKNEEEAESLKGLKNRVIEEYRLSHNGKTPITSRVPYDVCIKTKKPAIESARRIMGMS